MRFGAFILPVAIAPLLLISVFAALAYKALSSDIENAMVSDSYMEYQKAELELINKALLSDVLSEKRLISYDINLSGLYNISHLVRRDVNGSPAIDERETLIVARLFENCEVSPLSVSKVSNSLLSSYQANYVPSLLELLNNAGFEADKIVQLISCMRFAPPLYKINISFSDIGTLAALFHLDRTQAVKLKNYIDKEIIFNKDGLLNFMNSHSKSSQVKNINDVIIANKIDHVATIFEENGETFGFVDKLLYPELNWTLNWAIFLWLPEVVLDA